MADAAHQNPYVGPEAARLRELFVQGEVSEFENTIGRPRFMALLPVDGVRRAMDYGCGPHKTPLRARYPDAEILCVDKVPAMLPAYDPADPNTHPVLWPEMPRRLRAARRLYGQFDVIACSMVAQYVPWAHGDGLSDLVHNLAYFLTDRGSLALSLPHHEDSARFVADPSEAATYVRGIGATGLQATMVHRPVRELIDLTELAFVLPRGYRLLVDEPADESRQKRRLNLLFRPPTVREVTTDSLKTLFGIKTAPGRRIWLTPGPRQRYGYRGRVGKPLVVER